MPATNAQIEVKRCSNCGAETECEIPDDVGKFKDLLRSLPVLCGECADKQEAAEAKERAGLEEAERNRELLRRINASGIPQTMRGLTLDGLDRDEHNGDAIESAREWADGGFQLLVLSGPVGTGKTWIAAAAANEALRRREVLWFAATRFMTQARAGFKHASREQITDVLTKPHLALVLDDIDKANPTDYTKEILFQAIDDRLQNGTPMIITTNKGYVELEAALGEPIASRISTGRAHRIEGPDRRRRKRAA